MTRQKGIIYMGVPMLRELPVFVFVCVCMNTSLLVSKDCLEMVIFIAIKTNSPYAVRTFSFVPLVLGQLSEKKHLAVLQYSDSLINVSSGNSAPVQ